MDFDTPLIYDAPGFNLGNDSGAKDGHKLPSMNDDNRNSTQGVQQLISSVNIDWSGDVTDKVREHYKSLGFTDDDIQREVAWELKAHAEARNSAIKELKRLMAKDAGGDTEMGEALANLLTVEFIRAYYEVAPTHGNNQLAKRTTDVIRLTLGDCLLDGLEKFVGHTHKRDGVKVSEDRDAYLNLYSLGLIVVRGVVDRLAALVGVDKEKLISAHQLAQEIGEMLNNEIKIWGFARLNADAFQKMIHKLPAGVTPDHAQNRLKRSMQRRVEKIKKSRRLSNADVRNYDEHDDLRLPTVADYLRHWGADECKQVGSMYLNLLVQAGIIKVVPVQGKQDKTWVNRVSLTQAGHEIAAYALARELGRAFDHVPMLLPPIPHSALPVKVTRDEQGNKVKTGGTIANRECGVYILDSYAKTHRRTISHSKLAAHTDPRLIEQGIEPEWVRGLNANQNTPQALNTAVFDVMKRISDGESPIGTELINIHSWMRSGKARKSDLDRIKEGYNAKIALESDPAKVRKLERELCHRCKQLHEQAIKDLSSVSRCKRITKTADALIEVGGADRFWLGWFVDKRRRHYALGPISPIEREVSKALLLMGEPLVLDTPQMVEQARADLLWELATNWGAKTDMGAKSDKLTADERIAWARTQIGTILMVADDPLTPEAFKVWAGEVGQDHLGRDVMVGGAGEPFCFLSACIEYKRLFGPGRITLGMSTRHIIRRDCTASGPQLISMSVNSRRAAELVNATEPTADNDFRPVDLYTKTLRKAEELLKVGFTYRMPAGQETLIIGDPGLPQYLNSIGVGRSAAKPTVMTTCYNAGEDSNLGDVLEALKEDGNPFPFTFRGFDDSVHARLYDADPEWCDEHLQKVVDMQGTPARTLIYFDVEEEPVEPKRLLGESDDDFAVRVDVFAQEHDAWVADEAVRDAHIADINDNCNLLKAYINKVRALYELNPIKRPKNQVWLSDVCPEALNLVRAIRTALSELIPDVIRFRDEITKGLKPRQKVEWPGYDYKVPHPMWMPGEDGEQFDWRIADADGGRISFSMPHGWVSSQKHNVISKEDTSTRLKVWSIRDSRRADDLKRYGWEVTKAAAVAAFEGTEVEVIPNPITQNQRWQATDEKEGVDFFTDEETHRKAIVPNLIHNMDAALWTALRLVLQENNVDTTSAHDCYFVHIGRSPQLMGALADAVHNVFGAQAGDQRPLDLFLRDLGLEGLLERIRVSEDDPNWFDPGVEIYKASNFIC